MPNSAATNLRNSPTEAGVASGRILGELDDRSSPISDSPFCAEDYVQLACTLRKSVRLSVQGPATAKAEIAIFRGELWRVSDEHGGGSAAFRRLLGRPCTVQVEVLSEADRGPRNVFHNWEQLLLLAAMENTSGEAVDDRPSLDSDTRQSRPSGVRRTLARRARFSLASRGSRDAHYVRELQRSLRETRYDVGNALQELKSRPDRRWTFLAAAVLACVAVFWLNFMYGEFRRLSTSHPPITSSSLR